jgi:hypothetical protein
MKDEVLLRRQFILSSFARQKIRFSSQVYYFADKLIRENWSPPLDSLEKVDRFIFEEFHKFINHG